jgi:phosphatidylglycerophosphatase A
MFIATGCFIGKFPFAPGTFGSLLGFPLCFALSTVRVWTAVLFAACFIGVAVLVAHFAENLLQKKDPGCIVIDEIAGMMVTFIGIPFNLVSAGAGFFIFRALDILKPFPIRLLDRNVPGGAGIVSDDVAAGIYGNLALRVFCLTIGSD